MSQPVPSYAREFKRIIEEFRYNRGIREIFIDWLEIAACAVHQEPYHLGLIPRDEAFDAVETQYMSAIQKYEREELESFAKLLGLTKLALWEAKNDFLGQLYMELEISQNRSGEFFTPFPLSLMTAKMMLGDIGQQIEEKGFVTVAKPACGGGGMLIAAAQVIEAAGYQPGKVMFFDATDISKPCCDMAYIQTSILELSGIVRHGNTLSQEMWNQRFTPICRIFPHRTRRFLNSLIPDTTASTQQATDETPLMSTDQQANISNKEPLKSQPDTDKLIPLADETERFQQGRLF